MTERKNYHTAVKKHIVNLLRCFLSVRLYEKEMSRIFKLCVGFEPNSIPTHSNNLISCIITKFHSKIELNSAKSAQVKSLFALIIFFVSSTICLGQSYLGLVTDYVNFRQGPGTEHGVISTLQPDDVVFIISLELENEFYQVIDIATDRLGYIHKSFIEIAEKIEENESGVFVPNGETHTYNPQLEIVNSTSLLLTLVLNSETHALSPGEEKTITLSPGKYSYRASAPGVIPYIGTEYLESNTTYGWQFYISTEWR
jgi:hypothetical protein